MPHFALVYPDVSCLSKDACPSHTRCNGNLSRMPPMNAVIRSTEPGSSAGEEPLSAHPAALGSGPRARCQTTAAGSGRRPALFHAPSTAAPGPGAPPTTSRTPRRDPATPAHTHPCPRASRCFGRPLHAAGDGGPILLLAVAVTGRAKQIRSPAVCIAPCLHMNAHCKRKADALPCRSKQQ